MNNNDDFNFSLIILFMFFFKLCFWAIFIMTIIQNRTLKIENDALNNKTTINRKL